MLLDSMRNVKSHPFGTELCLVWGIRANQHTMHVANDGVINVQTAAESARTSKAHPLRSKD